MCICSCIYWSYGLCLWVFQLYCLLLFNCINGASSFVELWTSVSRRLCFEDKERPAESSFSEPVCRGRLGYSNPVAGSCMFVGGDCSFVCQGLEILQGHNAVCMQQIRTIHCFFFCYLVPHRHLFSRDVLDSSLSLGGSRSFFFGQLAHLMLFFRACKL